MEREGTKILLLFLSFCYGSCVFSQATGFYAGEVGSCQLIPETNYCDMITHEVPALVARLTRVIEVEIKNDIESSAEQNITVECDAFKKEILCKQRFPKCSSAMNRVSIEPPIGCEESLLSKCGNTAEVRTLLQQGSCNLTETILYGGSCTNLEQFGNAAELQHCNILSDGRRLVTDWMYHYIKIMDRELQSASSSLESSVDCWKQYQQYLCNFIGHCVGSETHLINSKESCESFISCYSHSVSEVLQSAISCEDWPSNSAIVSQTPTMVIEDVRLPSLTTSRYQLAEPNNVTFIVNSFQSIKTNHNIIILAIVTYTYTLMLL